MPKYPDLAELSLQYSARSPRRSGAVCAGENVLLVQGPLDELALFLESTGKQCIIHSALGDRGLPRFLLIKQVYKPIRRHSLENFFWKKKSKKLFLFIQRERATAGKSLEEDGATGRARQSGRVSADSVFHGVAGRRGRGALSTSRWGYLCAPPAPRVAEHGSRL